jgi:O-Antigen ligase
MHDSSGMVSTRWGTTLLLAAGAVFLAGCLAWVFPRAGTATAGEWLLPALSLTGLGLAIALASPWPMLRGLLLVLAIMLVVAWNRASMTSTSHFAGAALGCLAMVGIGRSAQTARRLRVAMLAFLCGAAVILLVGLVGVDHPPGAKAALRYLPMQLPSIRLGLAGLDTTGSVNPNALASAALMVLPVGIAVMLVGRRRPIDWWTLLPASLVVAVVGTATLAVTISRTALIAVWLMALGLLVRGMRSRLHRVILGIVILAPLVILTARLSFVITQDEAWADGYFGWVSARGRTQIMSQALDRWKQAPWLGIGLNEYRRVYAARPGDVPQGEDVVHAHNIFLQTGLDIGLVGSAAYWSVLAFLWVRASQAARGTSRTARAAAIGAAFSLIGVTLFGLTDAVPLGAKVGTLQWIAGGLILAAWQIRFDRSDAGDDVDADSSKPVTSRAAA